MKTYKKSQSLRKMMDNEGMEDIPPLGRAPLDKDTLKGIMSGKERLSDVPPLPRKKMPESIEDMLDEDKIRKNFERESVNMAKGGKVSSASKRADGIAVKGKTRGRMV